MTTHAVLIVDKSGSMWKVKDDVIGGFNSYLDGLTDENILVSCLLFDTNFKIFFRDKTPKKARRLSLKSYVPSGNTALYDAVGKTLDELVFPKEDKVLCVIQTDGEENSSKEFNASQIKELVHQRQHNGWDFIYLGASQDAWKGSSAIGIPRAQTFTNIQSDSASVRGMYSGVTAATNTWSYGACDPLAFGMDEDGQYIKPIAAAAASYMATPNAVTSSHEATGQTIKTSVWSKK